MTDKKVLLKYMFESHAICLIIQLFFDSGFIVWLFGKICFCFSKTETENSENKE